tara:strand:- start:105 stop:569 length:465 start_codon:yes stop_codon:yes gene_type:complete
MGLKIKLIIACILFTVITSGYFYIRALQGRLEAAAEVQQRMEGVINQQKIVMERQTADMKLMQDVNKDISDKVNQAQSEINDLNRKFTKRELSIVASSKPSETQIRVNRGTKDALRCNEIVTGSPLTDGEKSGKIKNSICNNYIESLKGPKDEN